jgi:alpha-galactosidase
MHFLGGHEPHAWSSLFPGYGMDWTGRAIQILMDAANGASVMVECPLPAMTSEEQNQGLCKDQNLMPEHETRERPFEFDTDSGRWTYQPRRAAQWIVASDPTRLKWRRSSRRARWTDTAFTRDASPTETGVEMGDPILRLVVDSVLDREQPRLRIEFMVLDPPGMLVWRAVVGNPLEVPVFLEEIELLGTGGPAGWRGGSPGGQIRARRPRGEQAVHTHTEQPRWKVFVNGWQSWSYAGVLTDIDRQPSTRLGLLTRPMQVNQAAARPRGAGRFSSDMFGALISVEDVEGMLAGFLAQRQAFGNLHMDLTAASPELRLTASLDGIRLDPGGQFTTDWACLQFIDPEERPPFRGYLEMAARVNGARKPDDDASGWSSWYYFFQDISEAKVEKNLEWARVMADENPLDVIQIDDGFQVEVGDWRVDAERFPHGMRAMSEKIRESGFRPGLWLAPLIAKPGAETIRAHPDWVLHGKVGLPSNPGWVWNTIGRALDATHPGVQEHVARMIKTAVVDWGFDYLKLDFLYAGALPGRRHDSSLTNAQALHKMLCIIREAAGDSSFLVGCGCPLGSGIGIFDSMRVGPDVAPNWSPRYSVFSRVLRSETGIPSARNSLLNSIYRSPLNGIWWMNDSDCMLMRLEENDLNEHEVKTLATVVSILGGAVFVSDHLPDLPPERKLWLSKLLPPLEGSVEVLDFFHAGLAHRMAVHREAEAGSWDLLALVNWMDHEVVELIEPGELGLDPLLSYHVLDFWNERYHQIKPGERHPAALPAHGVGLFSLRALKEEIQWIGDTLHISQGSAIKSWRPSGKQLHAVLDLQKPLRGGIWFYAPSAPRSCRVGGAEVPLVNVEKGVYTARVETTSSTTFEIELG